MNEEIINYNKWESEGYYTDLSDQQKIFLCIALNSLEIICSNSASSADFTAAIMKIAKKIIEQNFIIKEHILFERFVMWFNENSSGLSVDEIVNNFMPVAPTGYMKSF